MFDHTVEQYENGELIDFKRFDAQTKNLIYQKVKSFIYLKNLSFLILVHY